MNKLNSFSIARLPRIEFGSGKISLLPELVKQYGRRLLIVTGEKSFLQTSHWDRLKKQLEQSNIEFSIVNIPGEPSPEMVDQAVAEWSSAEIELVLGVGGGSALDAAKAIAGLLNVKRSVMDYLEGVGPELTYEGPAVPFIAVPTTAGTGSEATKNAVLSKQSLDGFKKSFRDDKLVAEYAIVDPDLLASCPPSVIAANGMDALTQLLESYVSIKANPFNDGLTLKGLVAAGDGLLNLYESHGQDSQARGQMAFASMISGISLAQTGLGSVHGLASPLGAFYPIPHGVVCGTLVAKATEINIQAMKQREPDNQALLRYTEVAQLLSPQTFNDPESAWAALIDLLAQWTEKLDLQTLSSYGLEREGLDHVVAHSRGSSMKTNPIVLTDEEIKSILLERL